MASRSIRVINVSQRLLGSEEGWAEEKALFLNEIVAERRMSRLEREHKRAKP